MKDPDQLSAREWAFVEHYVCTLGPDNKPLPAGRAYERAGYKAKGRSADAQACKILTKGNIKAAIKQRRREMAEQNQFEKWQLIEFLQRVITTPVGSVDAESDLAQELQVDELSGATTKIKMPEKLGAAKQLATLLNWNGPEKVEVSASEELAELVGLIRGN